MIRHGQSTANASGVWQGQLDYPLSETGRSQALRAGEALRGGKISGLYASPLSRARETAEIAARASDFTGDVVTVAGLAERSGGLFEGKTREEREREMPEVVEKFRAAPEREGWTVIGAETDEEILARFAPAVEEILSRHAPGERVVVVTHGGVMRAYLRDLLGPETLSGDERVRNASITRIEWPAKSGERPRLIELAGTSHLPEEEPSTPEPTSE